MDRKIFIVGAGTYGEVMKELAEILDYEVLGFYDEADEKQGREIMGVAVLGKFSGLKRTDLQGKQYIVAIGDNTTRSRIMEEINASGGFTPTLIHPAATVSPSARIGKGVYIQANAYIWTKATIGDYCIVSPNVVICHHTSIDRGCLISNTSGIGASIEIGKYVFVGMGATLVTGMKKVGDSAVIGAGAVVLKDVEEEATYVGVPARKIQ